jgi:3-dehydroquinate dehydratase-2
MTARKKVYIINGPNLNLIGIREPDIYGSKNFDDYLVELKNIFPMLDIYYYQSNIEGEIINEIQRVGFDADLILLNAGGYTHTSIAIADCVAAIKSDVIEVHITNPYARESYRQHSFLSSKCKAIVAGFGLKSYELALNSIL